jgi:hypothetical protein
VFLVPSGTAGRCLSGMVATRCAPALPALAIATSGSLDFSSCVYREGLGRKGR